MAIDLLEFIPVSGVRPATGWLLHMTDRRVRDRLIQRINAIRAGSMGDYKSLGYRLFEFREFYQTGYRIYFIRPLPNKVVLLCAGSKNTQKRDILRARDLQQIHDSLERPLYESYAKTMQSWLGTTQTTFQYLSAHHPLTDSHWSTEQVLSIMLWDLVSVYGYLFVAHHLEVSLYALHQMIHEHAGLSDFLRLKLLTPFGQVIQSLPKVANQ